MNRPLSARQRVFIAKYLRNFNATAAALAAGYSERSAASIGHENLKKPEIAAEIERRLDELTMGTEEALLRLTEQGRGAHTAFISNDGRVDIVGLKAAGLGHLIKSTKETRWGRVVEFYDGQAAIDKILRVRGAYVERRELTGAEGGPVRTQEVGRVHGGAEHIAAVARILVEAGAVELRPVEPGGDAEDDEVHAA